MSDVDIWGYEQEWSPDECTCDQPNCKHCYPPALEFVPAERPVTGAAEPDDYFEREP